MEHALIFLLVALLVLGACCLEDDEEEDWLEEPEEEDDDDSDDPGPHPPDRTRLLEVRPGETVTLVFSQPIHPDGVDGRIRLVGADGAEIAAAIEVLDNDVVLTPADPLVPGSTVTVEVDRKTRDYRWRKLRRRYEETFVVPSGVPLLVLPALGPPIVLPPAAAGGHDVGE